MYGDWDVLLEGYGQSEETRSDGSSHFGDGNKKSEVFAERGDEGGEFAKKKKGKSMRIKIRLKFFVGISIRVKEVERRDRMPNTLPRDF